MFIDCPISCSTKPGVNSFCLELFQKGYGFWDYGRHYWDLVIDYLNCNYDSIARGRPPYQGISQNEDEGTVSIRKNLSELDIHEIRDIVDTVFIDDRFPELSASTKYYAFINTLGDHDDPILPLVYEYGTIVTPQIDVSEMDQDLFNAFLSESGGDLLYSNVCNELKRQQINIPINNSYSFASMRDAVVYLLFEMISKNCIVKKCPNCKRYFVPTTRSDTIYCDSPAPQMMTKTCKEYKKYASFLKKTQDDEAVKIYRQIYNADMNKIRRLKAKGDNYKELDSFLDRFINVASQWKSDVKAGTKTEDEYVVWLRTVKEKKVL